MLLSDNTNMRLLYNSETKTALKPVPWPKNAKKQFFIFFSCFPENFDPEFLVYPTASQRA